MARPNVPSKRADQPRDSRPLRELKEVLALDEADWQEFRRHALDGFIDYERTRRTSFTGAPARPRRGSTRRPSR